MSGNSSFELSHGGDDLPLPSHNDIEKLWEDVQSLVRHSFESVQRSFQDICDRMEQMEEKMSSLQTLVNERLPDSSGDKVDECGIAQKRKRKTPVTLQVHEHMLLCRYVCGNIFIFIFRMQWEQSTSLLMKMDNWTWMNRKLMYAHSIRQNLVIVSLTTQHWQWTQLRRFKEST